MKFVAITGRVFFSFIFLSTIMVHFTTSAVGYAATKGVPGPVFLVPASGIIAVLGALSVLFGYKAKAGAWLLVLFLVPVTLFMHAFWKETDPLQAQNQMSHFMKNLSMLGGALMITYFGAGPLSLDEELEIREHKSPLIKHDRTGRREIKSPRIEERIKTEAYNDPNAYLCPFIRQKFQILSDHAPGK